MGSRLKREGGRGLSRRDFLKVSAAGAAGVAGMAGFDWQIVEPAFATELLPGTYDTYHTTCPYCSASCGQVVAVANSGTGNGYAAGDIIDIWGDPDSPINQGGLCAKGAGSYQLVTNKRRIGAFAYNPADPYPMPAASSGLCYDASYTDGIAWKRTGNGAWGKMSLDAALTEIAPALVSARGPVTPGLSGTSNAKGVQFFGCSHMNNEQNYLYRKIIANFGTSQVEHQARI
ncbi:MAG TPA: twin-arginine translocation signal domain-containing protein [Coriobacteriia bacterium]